MKADLRLGNHINAVIRNMKISDGIVTEITQEHVRLNDIVFAYKYLQPIQLTEEKLLEIGFEKLNAWDDMDIYRNGKIDIEVNNLGFYFDETKVESVHHLQNIYHALTGEELTPIKERI